MRSLLQRLFRVQPRHELPLGGYKPSVKPAPKLASLSEDELDRLNRLLPWQAFVVDQFGRRFGNSAWRGKRDSPQEVPDPRIVLMHDRFNLSGKTILEVGCFEGIHTAGLLGYAACVKAVDSRIENVVKTIVRCAMLGLQPQVHVLDVEAVPADADLLSADYAHHVGVLYHLHDPVRHLLDMGRFVREGIMLDTHFAEPHEATATYAVGGIEYRYKSYREYGRNDVFSGMAGSSKWLLLDDIISVLGAAGFTNAEVVELRRERNGPRALLFASK